MADDLGWSDMGCYGNLEIGTPNLDQLAAEGMLFNQAYSSGSVCSPTRAALITGQYPARLSIHGHISGTSKKNLERGMPNFLDSALFSVGDMFKAAGYATAHIGKWHLGASADSPLPSEYGFDYHVSDLNHDTIFSKGFKGAIWARHNRPVSSKVIFEQAMNYLDVRDDQNQPFYLQVWLNDPHSVLNPSDEQIKKFAQFHPSSKPIDYHSSKEVYYATVNEMDRQLGVFMAYLKTKGLDKNSIIIFTSDNGPETQSAKSAGHSAAGTAGPFRGKKRSLYEGGIRVPFIVKWKGVTPNASINPTILSSVDLMPTFRSLIKGHIPSDVTQDGENLIEAFRGQNVTRTTPVFWEFRENILGREIDKSPILAMRLGKYKLLSNIEGKPERLELYDLQTDFLELNNLSRQLTETSSRMRSELLNWHARLPQGAYHPAAGVLREWAALENIESNQTILSSEDQTLDFLLYPNPTERNIVIKRCSGSIPTYYQMVSLTGELIDSQNISWPNEENEVTIEPSTTVLPGTYIIKIGNSLNEVSKKIRFQ